MKGASLVVLEGVQDLGCETAIVLLVDKVVVVMMMCVVPCCWHQVDNSHRFAPRVFVFASYRCKFAFPVSSLTST